jgi:protein phosphatase
MTIVVPPAAAIALVGPAGAGKTTFAAGHFAPTETLSSDYCRRLVADDENDQSATPQAFAVLYFIAARRLRRGRVTVVDSTNVRRADRQRLLWLAERYRRPAVAVLFNLPLDVCLQRAALRTDRAVDADAVRRQWEAMPHSTAPLLEEGFSYAYEISAAGEPVTVRR